MPNHRPLAFLTATPNGPGIAFGTDVHDPDRLPDIAPNAKRLTLRDVIDRERGKSVARRQARTDARAKAPTA